MELSHVWEACLRTLPNSPSVIALYCQITKISLNAEYDYCSAVERICVYCTHEGQAMHGGKLGWPESSLHQLRLG